MLLFFFLTFSDFFPIVIRFLRRLPFIGRIFEIPYLKEVIFFFKKKKQFKFITKIELILNSFHSSLTDIQAEKLKFEIVTKKEKKRKRKTIKL